MREDELAFIGGESLPEAVRREVWRRHGGACVECGSRKKLMFSRLLPASLGGTATASNIILVCRGVPVLSVCHRTRQGEAVLRDGFRDSDHPLSGGGATRGVLVSAWEPLWDEHEHERPDDRDVVRIDIPRALFAEHKLDRQDGALGPDRAMIPADVLNQILATGGVVDEEGRHRLPGLVLDEESKLSLHRRFVQNLQGDAAEVCRRQERQAEAERKTDIDILFGAGDTETARSALRSLLSERCAVHLASSEEGVLDFFDFRSLAYLLAVEGKPEEAAEVIEKYKAAFRPAYPTDPSEPVTPQSSRNRVDDPVGELLQDAPRLRAGVFVIPEWFLKKVSPPWPEELCVPKGSLFRSLPEPAVGNVRFVFVGGPMLYVDQRGHWECVSGETIGGAPRRDLAEEYSRVAAMVRSRQWNEVAVSVAHRLLEVAEQLGGHPAWAYSIGISRDWFRDCVKTLVGRSPSRAMPWGEDARGLVKPHRGRWLYDYSQGERIGDPVHRPSLFAIHCLRGREVLKVPVPPSVAVWRFPDRSDTMLQAFCDTLGTSDGTPLTVVLPDTPCLRDFALRYNAKQHMTKVQRTMFENLNLFNGDGWATYSSVSYAAFRLSHAVDRDGTEFDGDLLAAALEFLDANHQVRVSPWDAVRDRILKGQLGPRSEESRRSRTEMTAETDTEAAEEEWRKHIGLFWTSGPHAAVPRFSEHLPYPLADHE